MVSASTPVNCGINHYTISLVFKSLYFVLCVPALLLNIMAAWISWKLKNKSSFIVYLKNLVGADLLMTFLILLRADAGSPGSRWGLKAFNCQFGSVLFYLCMYVSIVLMGVISLDRFFKIVQPGGKLFGQSPLFGKVVSAAIWVVLLSTISIPAMVLTNEKPKNTTTEFCMAMKSDLGKRYHEGVILVSTVIFFVVLVVIGICYTCIAKKVIESYRNSGSRNTEGKRRVKAKVFIVLVVFLVCFAPYHIARPFYLQQQVIDKNDCRWAYLRVVNSITLFIATSNVCLDPLIYVLLCKAFRQKLYEFRMFRLCLSSVSEVSGEEQRTSGLQLTPVMESPK
ncbi:P2Y purinoceptor 13-like [Engraulis encrasicolus]|uniref:P2Y purinoceptor 13-like n=1 Tax=Engraulis encrasicolus TaxID=184585 RepID=UPI002FD60117